MKSSNKDDLVLVGRVTGAHGIHGGLKVHSYAESTAIFDDGEMLILTLPGGKACSMTIRWAKPHGRKLLMGVDAITDRNQAESLIGASLFVDKSRLPALEADTYYWFDLVGLDVVDRSGVRLGRLDEVISTPGNDVYVVKGERNRQPREWLIPAIGDVILNIDLEGKIMVVDPPEGL